MTALSDTPHSVSPAPAGVGRTLRADARRNREAVITAAKELFADRGLDVQIPDVAKRANVGVGTVYRHFATKDELIAALVAERFERLAQKARETLEQEDAWEGMSAFIHFCDLSWEDIPNDRLRPRADHPCHRRTDDRPLAAAGRDHPRRPAGARERQAP
jgi:AcrR family transcriptional regulator